MVYQIFWRYIHKRVFGFMRLRLDEEKYRNYNNIEWMNSKDTDFTRKYTKDDYYYELEEQFLDALDNLPVQYSTSILLQIDKALSKDYLEPSSLFSANYGAVAGVVKSTPPMFYRVKFFTLKDRYPVLYKLNIISSDEYLDYLNKIKNSKSEFRVDKRISM